MARKDGGGERSTLGVGRDQDRREAKEVTLHRVGVEDGIVLPMIMGWHWSTIDPTDLSRARYMEEIAAELGSPPEGEEQTKHHKRY
ncbi:MAG: hypothetical protein GX058_02600 [Firmicutes bacterium]|nr:hypothetical protein [Bacillota bacterium]